MRLNENTALIGTQVVLVPYKREHVAVYHEWMKRPDLLEATASEPLTLEEEYEMQSKWHLDEDKLTFIVLELPKEGLKYPPDIQKCRMIGDVNLFLPEGPQGDVECEVMIAEDDARGRGIAKEALSLLLNYAMSSSLAVHPSAFLARIGTSNTASIRLFESLGFTKVKVVQAFNEAEMRFGRRRKEASEKVDEWEDDFAVLGDGELQALAKERWAQQGELTTYDSV